MTRNEAMSFALSAGKPITHKYFGKGEYVRYQGKELVDEDGIPLPQNEFIDYIVNNNKASIAY